jgi:hypothetical protein
MYPQRSYTHRERIVDFIFLSSIISVLLFFEMQTKLQNRISHGDITAQTSEVRMTSVLVTVMQRSESVY